MLRANYFDARSTRLRTVNVSLSGTNVHIRGDDIERSVPYAELKIDERLGRAARRLRLPDGAFCEVQDLAGLDALLSSMGHRDGWVDRMQRQSRFVLIALIASVAIVLAAYRWGLPWASAKAAQALPPSIGKTLSVETLQVLDGHILLRSKLPMDRQQAISDEFRALRLPDGGRPDAVLRFRDSPALGANAFTLPDGSIVVLDDLVTTIADDRQIIAVFAHELGHAHHRHGLQNLLRSSVVGAFWAFYVGDVSHLLAAAPAALLQARYSQELERQADDYGAELLVHNGMSPNLLADALEKLVRAHPQSAQGGYLASHPSTDERMHRLRAFRGVE